MSSSWRSRAASTAFPSRSGWQRSSTGSTRARSRSCSSSTASPTSPSGAAPLSPLHATVADAVRLGADAVGYTLYLGTDVQDRDFAQLRQVREEAQRLAMPLIVWSYPRGSAVDAKGGRTPPTPSTMPPARPASWARTWSRSNFPHPAKRDNVPPAYTGCLSSQEAINAVVRSAKRNAGELEPAED
ncbi:MAG: hypothetical protein M3Y33_14575 [Actinomycetota bacterium]|nr:hypothetical protein [Actinomycetota bacterium]